MQDAKSRADRFDGLYRALKEKVEAAEQVQANQEPIHSEVEAVKRQMDEHKVKGEGFERPLSLFRGIRKMNYSYGKTSIIWCPYLEVSLFGSVLEALLYITQ